MHPVFLSPVESHGFLPGESVQVSHMAQETTPKKNKGGLYEVLFACAVKAEWLCAKPKEP